MVGYEHCSIMVDGRVFVLPVTIHRTHGGSNIAVLEDVTKVAEQKRRLLKDRQRFMTIFDKVRDYAIYSTNLGGRVD